jgi:hypothetical protein
MRRPTNNHIGGRNTGNARNARNHNGTAGRAKTTQTSAQPNKGFDPLSWYSSKLDSSPMVTKALTAAFVAGGGDVGCQYIVQRDSVGFTWDPLRTGRFAFLGLFLIAPVSHHWYGFVMSRIPGSGPLTVAKRVACDQLFFAPLFIPTFVTSLKLLEGSSLGQAFSSVKESFVDMYTSNLVLWVPAMAFNFAFTPAKYQVLFSNCVGFIWNTWLSWKTQEEGKSIKEEEKSK